MPRFYFDQSGGGAMPKADTDGRLFDGIDEARAHAMTLLPVMGVELPMSPGEFRTWTSSIRDDGGRLVARFVMAIINDALGQEAADLRPPA